MFIDQATYYERDSINFIECNPSSIQIKEINMKINVLNDKFKDFKYHIWLVAWLD